MSDTPEVQTEIQKFIEHAKKFDKKAQELFRQMSNFMERTSRHVLELKKENVELKGILQRSLDLNTTVDQTLCKVLLAIRQNEYLQEWYPDQAKQIKKVVNG